MNQDNQQKFIILALIALLITLIIIKSPICQSLWLDETISLWTASGTSSDTISKALTYQGQSPLYFLIIRKLLAISSEEYFLRSLSFLSVIISGFIFYKILGRWLSNNLALLGSALFISSDGVILAALSVRPYGLALLASLLATQQLLRFIDTKRIAPLLLWIFAMVAMFYLHYLFALLAFTHLVFIWSNRENLSKAQFQSFGLGAVIGILCALPGIQQILSLNNRVESLSFAQIPSFLELFKALFSISSLIYVVGGIVFTRAIRKFKFNTGTNYHTHNLLPVIIWLLGAPLMFFAHAHLTGNSMFVERWFLWIIPASCLILLIPFQWISDNKSQFIAICMAIGFMIIREGERKWHIEDWKGAAKALAQESADIPVLLYSGLIELENPTWIGNQERFDYLSAPLLIYPIKQSHLLINSNSHGVDNSHYQKTIEPVLEKSSTVIVVSLRKKIIKDGEQFFVPELWAQQLNAAGFAKRTLLSNNSRNQVVVEKFERS